jgi:hypothetical protein
MTARRALLLAAVAALALAGCGRRGAPVAPEQRLPAPVADLTAVIREAGVEIGWTNPTRRVDRTLLRDLTLARVYRLEDDGRGEPKVAMLEGDAIAGWTELAVIRLAAPAPAVLEGNRLVVTDRRGLAVGRRYTYVVITADSIGRVSPPSRRVSVTYMAAPGAPAGLSAQAGDREARLAWQSPGRLIDGSPVPAGLAYEVLRAPAPDAPLVPVARTASGELAVIDRALENDRTYTYAVRAVRVEGGTTAYGPPSARVAVTPRSTTPPAPPSDLVAIPSEGAVRLSWRASPATDVSGYIVYRAAADGAFARVGAAPAPATTFVDRDVPRGAWRYVVTAEDSAAIRNESARSNEATVTVP